MVLHRLSLSPSETRLLEESGVRVVRSRSVQQTLTTLEQTPGPCVVVVSLSVGSQAPEQIFSAIADRRDRHKAPVEGVATSDPGRSNLRRAKNLGLDAVYAWPDGAFSQIARLVSAAPNVVMRRFAERAPAARALGLRFGLGIDARIMNISASGAMLDCDQTGTAVESIGFEFSVGGAPQPPIFAKVVWREPRGERVRLGLQFVDVSETTRSAIARFVEETNVIRVGGARAEQRPAPPGGFKVRVHHGTRRDYFRLEDTEGALTLIPDRPFFVPYELGDRVEVVPTSAHDGLTRFGARLVARQQHDPGRIDSRISWSIERDGANRDDVTDPRITLSSSAPPGPALTVDPRWTPLARALDALALGQDPFAGHDWFVVVPAPPKGSGAGLSARTFTLSLKGGSTVLLFTEPDRFLALPPQGNSPTRISIGRSDAADVPVANTTVSKIHALLHWNATRHGWDIEDVGSSNGTRLRASAFASEESKLLPLVREPLHPSTIVRLGKQRLHVLSAEDLRATCKLLLSQRRSARGD